MSSTGRELLGDYYQAGHLTHQNIEDLGLVAVTEAGELVPREEMHGKVFRVEDPDEPSGYVVDNTEVTGNRTVLCYLRRG